MITRHRVRIADRGTAPSQQENKQGLVLKEETFISAPLQCTAHCPAGWAVSTGQTRRAKLESVWCGGSSMRLAVVKPLDRRDIIAW